MSQGKAFRKAIKDNKPLQIVGTINAYSSLLAKKSGHKAIIFLEVELQLRV